MRTLHIRMKQHSHNAKFISEHFLKEGIKVYYPGIKSHPQFSLMKKVIIKNLVMEECLFLTLNQRKCLCFYGRNAK